MMSKPDDYGTIKYFKRRVGMAKAIYDSGWRALHKEIADYMRPGSRNALTDSGSDGAVKVHEKILDGSHFRFLQIAAAGFQGGLTDPTEQWFQLSAMDKALMDLADSREWLHAARDVMLAVLGGSNWYDVTLQFYFDLLSFCTSGIIAEEDADKTIFCKHLAPGTYYVLLGQDGGYDFLARRLTMTGRQLVEEYGEENVSVGARSAYQSGNERSTFTVWHVIERNLMAKDGRMDAAARPWVGVHFEDTTSDANGKFLRKGGYYTKPFAVQAWTREGDEVYGRGPGHQVLGPIKMVQRIEMDILMATSKEADPPMAGPANVKELLTFPGAYNCLTSGDVKSIQPVYAGGMRIDAVNAKKQDKLEEIKSGLFADLFLLLAEQEGQITATEAQLKAAERLAVLVPIVQGVQAGTINPLLERVFHICMDQGLFPPPPEGLQGQRLKIELIGPLAQAQKAKEIGKADRFMATVSGVSTLAAISPEAAAALKTVDYVNHIKNAAEAIGVAPNTIRSEKDIAEMQAAEEAQKQQMAQQQQAMMQMQAMEQGSQTAKNLAQSPMGPGGEGNALDAMLQQAGGAQQGAA